MVDYAQHQKDAIAFQQVVPYSICAMSTGVGKSVTTIGSMLANLHNDKLDKCIFVCTKGSLGEVEEDFQKHYNFKPMELNSKKSIEDFFNGKHTLAVTRYEWLKYFDVNRLACFTENSRLGMWWDEAQRLKNGSRDAKQLTGTKVHKYAKELRQYCSAFHLVTATPIMTQLDDLWSLMHLVEPNVLGTFEEFCDNYYERKLEPHPKVGRRNMKCPVCGYRLIYENGWDYCENPACQAIQSPYGFLPYKRKVKSIWNLIEYKNLFELSQVLQRYMFCFYPEQDICYHEHTFDLSKENEDNYYKIAKGIITRVDAGENVPFATRLLDLQYMVDKSLEKRQKLWQIANALKSYGFVLYVPFYVSMEMVEDTLNHIDGLEYRSYSGKDTDEDRDLNKKWFQNDPKNKCLIITASGGASLNLQVTNQMIFYGLGNGFGAMSQAMGRVIRLFSTFKQFHIHFILGNHTVDRYKYNCFLMYDEIMRRLMNNKLINTDKPINFNMQMKQEMRNDLCWRN